MLLVIFLKVNLIAQLVKGDANVSSCRVVLIVSVWLGMTGRMFLSILFIVSDLLQPASKQGHGILFLLVGAA